MVEHDGYYIIIPEAQSDNGYEHLPWRDDGAIFSITIGLRDSRYRVDASVYYQDDLIGIYRLGGLDAPMNQHIERGLTSHRKFALYPDNTSGAYSSGQMEKSPGVRGVIRVEFIPEYHVHTRPVTTVYPPIYKNSGYTHTPRNRDYQVTYDNSTLEMNHKGFESATFDSNARSSGPEIYSSRSMNVGAQYSGGTIGYSYETSNQQFVTVESISRDYNRKRVIEVRLDVIQPTSNRIIPYGGVSAPPPR